MSLFGEVSQILERNDLSRNVEESFEEFLHPDQDADDLQDKQTDRQTNKRPALDNLL